MQNRFYSNGKLLLTGEYVVLDGAKALAFPTKFGQDLVVQPIDKPEIIWNSFDVDSRSWFSDVFPFTEIRTNNASANQIRETLLNILHQVYLLNPDFLNRQSGFSVSTHLTFPRLWGLGTSSTLINNIATWTEVDAFTLLAKTFGGSGYDIAAAKCNHLIVYQVSADNQLYEEAMFNQKLTSSMYFVYLNRKQNSRASISSYRNQASEVSSAVSEISDITIQIQTATTVRDLQLLLNNHEQILSALLKVDTIKTQLFSDFEGTIKSLGGWGGDFILAISDDDPSDYFRSRGYDTILKFSEIIL
ncbi:MAG: GHMP kinase [Flavobacterium sp.]|nr:GHMP kinase [Flavobacterium sp.]